MKRALIVGGANGIGLSIATELASLTTTERIYIVDKKPVAPKFMHPKFCTYIFDLTQSDYTFFDQFQDIDTLMLTAGWGKLALFKDIPETDISSYFNVNTIPIMRLIKRFYPKLESTEDFYCGVMVSIAGFMSSPFFSVYAATKAALKIFIESINIELLKSGTTNQILNISPGSIQGTSFNHGETDLSLTQGLAQDILRHLAQKHDLFIPQYEETFHQVLQRYHQDFRAEGLHSYDYKMRRMERQNISI